MSPLNVDDEKKRANERTGGCLEKSYYVAPGDGEIPIDLERSYREQWKRTIDNLHGHNQYLMNCLEEMVKEHSKLTQQNSVLCILSLMASFAWTYIFYTYC